MYLASLVAQNRNISTYFERLAITSTTTGGGGALQTKRNNKKNLLKKNRL